MTPNSQAMTALLATIRKYEGGTYGQIYSRARGVLKSTDVSKMTLNEVLALQVQMHKGGSESTACGGYQFLRKTLLKTIMGMKLSGFEVWGEALQDRMAIHLMKGRGLEQYMAGALSLDDFCNNLAKEWASLPVVTAIRGQKRKLSPGQSYYSGDGLNKSHHTPLAIVSVVNWLKKPQSPVQVVPVVPAIQAPPDPINPVAVPPIAVQAPPEHWLVKLVKALFGLK